MSTDTLASPFTRLLALGLISEAQRDAALAHPLQHEIDADADLVRNLLWLVLRDVVAEGELEAKAAERLVSRQYDDVYAERKQVLETAVASLQVLREQLNGETIALLHAEGLLTEAERDNAAAQVPSEESFASPGAALAWMVISGLLERARFDALRARVQAESAQGGAGARLETVGVAHAILAKVHKAHVAAFWRAVLPGPPLLWLAALLLAVGGAAWYLVTPAVPDAAPSCDSSDTRKSVDRMLLMVKAGARAEPGGQDLPLGTHSVREAKEIGYASATRQRGCSATLELGKERMPYAYTIAPSQGDQGGYTITGAEPAMVEARYGRIGPDGNFGNKAEPVGRDNVERAFRAGVEALHSRGGSARQLLDDMRRPNPLSRTAPEREREIAEIEPLGACREVKAGTQYACRLLVERNDPMLAAIGAGSGMLLKAEFTFERDAGGQAWRMAPAFAEEFAKAVVGGRMDALTPKPAPAPAPAAPAQ